jgi:hypothetical protein
VSDLETGDGRIKKRDALLRVITSGELQDLAAEER